MEKLNKRFEKAFHLASAINQKDLPPDVMLRLYAYYKLATKDRPRFSNKAYDISIRNAFKFNAFTQLKGVSIKEAKTEYIKIVEHIIKETIN